MALRISVLEHFEKMVELDNYQFSGADEEMEAAASRIREKLINNVKYIGGVVNSDEMAMFKKLILRATRCRAYISVSELRMPNEHRIIGDDYDQKRHVFVIAFIGGGIMEEKVRRICGSYQQESIEIDVDRIQKDKEQMF